jgi:hypothetical protein
MGIDASIYQNLKPIEMPSMLDSQQKAMNLSSLAMQQQRGMQEMDAADRDAKYTAHLQKASVFGNALESLSSLPEQERVTAYPKARAELVASGILKQEDAPQEYDPGFYRQSLMRFRQSKEGIEQQLQKAQLGKIKAETARDYAMAKAKGMVDPATGEFIIGRKMLPADKVLSVNEGKQIPRMLEDIGGTIEANADTFGPVMGRINSANPYNEKAKTIDAQMRASAQAFGRFMEGGVLRKEDEEKYRKMFPQLSDTPGVAKNKLAIVDRLLKSKSAADVSALAASGYDTRAFNGSQPKIPGVPEVLTAKNKSGSLVNEAVAADRPKLKPGIEEDGFIYMGGDPANQKSWKRAR